MGLLKRVLDAIDSRLDTTLDRHLSLAIPEPRRHGIERIGCWPCCITCCRPKCDDLHRDACEHQQDAS